MNRTTGPSHGTACPWLRSTLSRLSAISVAAQKDRSSSAPGSDQRHPIEDQHQAKQYGEDQDRHANLHAS